MAVMSTSLMSCLLLHKHRKVGLKWVSLHNMMIIFIIIISAMGFMAVESSLI